MRDWSTPRGPWDGNAAFDVDLRPPLVEAWTQQTAPSRHDPPVVASPERVVVPTGGTDVFAIRAADGASAWQARQCRRKEYECYLAGPRVVAFRGLGPSGDYVTSVLDAASGESMTLDIACVPLGVYARDGHEWLWLRDHELRLDTLELRARELPLFGQVREGRLFGRRAMTSEARFGCWRAGGGDDPVWEVETDAPEDSVSVGQRSVVTHSRDGHFCVRSMDDGRLQWRLATDQTWESHRPWLVLDSVAVQVEDEQRLAAYDLATGAPAWRRTTDGTWSNLVATNGFIWTAREVATNRHEVVALRSADGDEAWKLALPEPAPRCLLALAGGSLLCDLKRRVTAWRGAGARPA